jgi:hypothetical protein
MDSSMRPALPDSTTRANHTVCPDCGAPVNGQHQCKPRARHLVAAGIIRRSPVRTTRLTATAAGITGSIRPAGA